MKIGVASAPVSWGIMESVPFPREYPYSRVLDEIAQAGYAGTELGPYGFLPTEPEALCKQLEQRKLTLCSAFVEVRLADRGAAGAGLETRGLSEGAVPTARAARSGAGEIDMMLLRQGGPHHKHLARRPARGCLKSGSNAGARRADAISWRSSW